MPRILPSTRKRHRSQWRVAVKKMKVPGMRVLTTVTKEPSFMLHDDKNKGAIVGNFSLYIKTLSWFPGYPDRAVIHRMDGTAEMLYAQDLVNRFVASHYAKLKKGS
jgi:hypothetical protein